MTKRSITVSWSTRRFRYVFGWDGHLRRFVFWRYSRAPWYPGTPYAPTCDSELE